MAVFSLNLMVGAATGFPGHARGQDALPSEYQMKAAYLYNFTKFVEWPPAAFVSAEAPLVIGVWGDDPFGDSLEGIIHDKKIEGHPLAIEHVKTIAEAKHCQVLFIAGSEKKRWDEISAALNGTSVLTVSEHWDRFIEEGGMIYLFTDGSRICFCINNEAARRAGLRISSKLMLLSKKPPA